MSTGAFISTVSVATGRSLVRGPGPGRLELQRALYSALMDAVSPDCIGTCARRDPHAITVTASPNPRPNTRFRKCILQPYDSHPSRRDRGVLGRWKFQDSSLKAGGVHRIHRVGSRGLQARNLV